MVTLLGVVLLCVFLIVSFSGANPAGQSRSFPSFKPDSNTSIPVPKIFLEQAFKDSVQKLNRIKKNNDSLLVVRKHKSDKILRLIHNLVHRKSKEPKDTVYISVPFDSFPNTNYINQVNLMQWQ